jgi:carbonic anhydrase
MLVLSLEARSFVMCKLTQIRRTILVNVCLLAIALILPVLAHGAESGVTLTPQQVIERLKEGNTRYVEGKSVHPNADSARREVTAKDGQHPIVTVLSCSDSRVPVELVLDQGIGDVFVVRVAGNVCRGDEAGAIEYGVDHVGTPVLVVLGHSKCGAVTAATMKANIHGNVAPLVASIQPAVARAQKEHPELHGKDLVPAVVEANVWQAIDDLFKASSIVRERVKDGKLKVVGALYDIESGKIQWLGERPKTEDTHEDHKSP